MATDQQTSATTLSRLARIVGAILLTMLVIGLLYWADLLPSPQPMPERTALRR